MISENISLQEGKKTDISQGKRLKKIPGKIILVDNELYEKDLLTIALFQKNWDVVVDYFTNVEDAIEHLKKYRREEIFLIISDVTMAKMDGLDFKKNIDTDDQLNSKAIPFIFASNTATQEQVEQAFSYRIQGFFKKPLTVDKQAEMLDIIIKYWIIGRHPNKGHQELIEDENMVIGQ